MTTALEFLEKVAETIKARDPIYGGSTDAGFRIALYWNVYLELNPPPLSASQVMQMLLLMKIARSSTENDLIDAIGYAACTAEAKDAERQSFEEWSCDYPECADCYCLAPEACSWSEDKRRKR